MPWPLFMLLALLCWSVATEARSKLMVGCEATDLPDMFFYRFCAEGVDQEDIELRVHLINNRFNYKRHIPLVVPYKRVNRPEDKDKSFKSAYEDITLKAPWMDIVEASLWTSDGDLLLSNLLVMDSDALCNSDVAKG
jgi:hypothetical protein